MLLINGFVPHVGDIFHILNWGTLSGSFTALQFPPIPGLGFSTSQLYITGNIPVFSTLAGDFNQDGHVNAADIPVMAAALTDIFTYKSSHSLTDADLLSIGDLDHSGAINNADVQSLLDLLKSGGGSLASVPEPTSFLLLVLALPGLAFAVFRRRGTPWSWAKKSTGFDQLPTMRAVAFSVLIRPSQLLAQSKTHGTTITPRPFRTEPETRPATPLRHPLSLKPHRRNVRPHAPPRPPAGFLPSDK